MLTGREPAAPDRTSALVLSLFLSHLGFAMTAVGTTLLLVDRFGVGAGAGLALALQVLPNVLLGPLAGELVSRWDPRVAAIGSSVSAGALAMLYPAVDSVAAAQVLALLIGIAVLPGIPGRMALRGAAVPQARQQAASGYVVSAERLGRVCGPVLATAITASVGYTYVFYVEGLLALCASVLLLRIRAGRPGPAGHGRSLRGVYARAGRVLWRDRLIREYTLTGIVYSLGVGALRLFLAALLVSSPSAGDAGLGLLVGALALGGVLGGLVTARVPAGLVPRVYVSLAVVEAALWCQFLWVGGTLWWALLLLPIGFVEGLSTGLFLAEVQARLAAGDVGRYFALLSPLTDAAIALGALLASALGASTLAGTGGALIAACAVLPLVCCPRLLRAAVTPAPPPPHVPGAR